MFHIRLLMTALVLMVCLAVNATPPAATPYNFAVSLYQRQDYQQSVTEFERVIFFSPNTTEAEKSFFMIGAAQEMAQEWLQASQSFRNYLRTYPQGVYVENAQYRIIECMFSGKYYASARSEISQFHTRYPESVYRDDAAFLNAMISFMSQDWKQGEKQFTEFCQLYPNSQLHSAAQKMAQGCCQVYMAPQKSHRTAATLSAIIPGTGQMYSGRRKDGIAALLMTAAAGFLAVNRFDHSDTAGGLLFSLIGASFYMGSIYGAGDAVEQVNRANERQISGAALGEVQENLLPLLGHPDTLLL